MCMRKKHFFTIGDKVKHKYGVRYICEMRFDNDGWMYHIGALGGYGSAWHSAKEFELISSGHIKMVEKIWLEHAE